MNRITASTVRPGALTAAARPIATCVAAATTAAPAAGEHEQEGAEHLGEQAPSFQRGILEPLNPPGVAREMSAGRQLAIDLPGAGARRRGLVLWVGWGRIDHDAGYSRTMPSRDRRARPR